MTAGTKSERLKRLVSHGYFAPELPPCFVSSGMAKYRRSILSGIDTLPLRRNGSPNFHGFLAEVHWFYFPRFGRNDRRHGVPNPISHLLLSRVIADNFVDIRRRSKTETLSSSPSIFDWSGPRSLVRPNIDVRDDFRIDLSSRREQYVAADIRAFYHSIYTHAIPWAIYGKAWAKNHRSVNEYGNLIDLLCRNSQEGQTIGLPVGPDTSRVLAETIASAVDKSLRLKLKISGRDAARYIDDYTISSPSDSGETILASLRQSLAEFELELNNDKSATYSTARRSDVGWKQAVRSYIPKGADVSSADIQRFFYEVGRVSSAHIDINVEKYAVQNARSTLVKAEKWAEVQRHLISLYRQNTTIIALLVEIVLLRQATRGDVDLPQVTEFIENRIPVLSQSNRYGEICWLLFMAIRLNVSIKASTLDRVCEDSSALAALLVVEALHRGLVGGTLNLANWSQHLNSDGLRGPMALYVYEGSVSGRIPGANPAFISTDQYFSLIQAKNVRFLDLDVGYKSVSATLRSLRIDNDRLQRLRVLFASNDEVNIDEFDADGAEPEEYEIENDDGY